MFSKQLLQSSTIRFALIALVLCGITLVGSRSTGQAMAAPSQTPVIQSMEQISVAASAVDPNAPAAQIFVRCPILEIGMDYRVNVVFIKSTNCVPSTGEIQYFVVVGTDSKKANQVLSVGLTAKAAGRSVLMTYDSSDTDVVNPQWTRKLLTASME